MESLYRYIIIISISTTILFIVYALLFKKENNFKLIRVYLISSLVFSLLLPFNQVSIDVSGIFTKPKEVIQESKTSVNNQALEFSNITSGNQATESNEELTQTPVNVQQLIIIIYSIISSIFLVRILFSIFQIIWYYMVSEKKKQNGFTIIYISKNSIPFSFFKLIFISKSSANDNINQIIEHEKIHAKQYHTIDLLLTELLVAAMWFNPFIWMYKKALQQVHEFLADEGVLNSGVDQLEYQSLLVNQAAEDRLVAVSSNFSYSLIKKRIMMMSQRKTHGHSRRKLLVLTPVILTLIFSVSIFNQTVGASVKIEKIPIEQKKELVTMATPTDIADVLDKNSKKVPKIQSVEKNALKEKTVEEVKKTNIPFKENELISPEDTTPTNILVAAVSPTRMNVLYIGVDNPVSIAVTGANMDDIEASIDNGTITGENGNYIVRVKEKRIATITVKAGNKVVTEKKFRVKRIPDPVAMVGGKRGGTTTKQELINAKGINVYLINFDFDMKFEVVSFNISAQSEGGYVQDIRQDNTGNFSKEQLELIEKLIPQRKIYIEDIKAKSPDGTIMSLGSLTFKIKE